MTPRETEARLREAVERARPRLQVIDDEAASRPRAEGDWSPKQVIGHLVDSASNNHQRFVRAQFTDDLVFPPYDGDRWVELQRYADAEWRELVTLWRGFNLHLARVIELVPDDVASKARARHNLDQIAFRPVPPEATLAFFMNDYVDHLEHHLGQIP